MLFDDAEEQATVVRYRERLRQPDTLRQSEQHGEDASELVTEFRQVRFAALQEAGSEPA